MSPKVNSCTRTMLAAAIASCETALARPAPTGLAADALSTGLYAMGPLKALEWCSHREGIEVLALVVSSNGLQALASSGLKGRIQPCDSELQVEYPVFSTSVR